MEWCLIPYPALAQRVKLLLSDLNLIGRCLEGHEPEAFTARLAAHIEQGLRCSGVHATASITEDLQHATITLGCGCEWNFSIPLQTRAFLLTLAMRRILATAPSPAA